MLIDSHCHLDFPELKGDLEAVLQRAKDAGVGLMVTISTRVQRFHALKTIVESHDNVYCSAGTHPHNAAEEPDITVEELRAALAARGHSFGYGTLQRFFARHRITRKKRPRTPASRIARTS